MENDSLPSNVSINFFMTQLIVHRIFWMAVSFLGVYSAVSIV